MSGAATCGAASWDDQPYDEIELELLSTVHWVATRGDAPTPEKVVARTYAWGDRKRQFSERQIRLVVDILTSKR